MKVINTVLSVETSCDDTSVAIVLADGTVVDQLSQSQDLEHALFGGVVPEIASRNHSIALLPLIDRILKKNNYHWGNIDALAVTNRPGLIGSLIVGVMTVKTLAQTLNKPFIGVNHLEGHILAPFLKDKNYQPMHQFSYPYIALAVSGGHSSLYYVSDLLNYTIIGTTKDDAAGEAFDKFAKLIGLGYPGGVLVDKNSIGGDTTKYEFPRSLMTDKNLMMSFSGLKSAAHRLIEKMPADLILTERANLCASFQEAIVEVLLYKLNLATRLFKCKNVVITGGVSANSRLRDSAANWAERKKINLVIPPIRYCTDNAAMIGYAGILRMNGGQKSNLDLGPQSQSAENDFQLKLWGDS